MVMRGRQRKATVGGVGAPENWGTAAEGQAGMKAGCSRQDGGTLSLGLKKAFIGWATVSPGAACAGLVEWNGQSYH